MIACTGDCGQGRKPCRDNCRHAPMRGIVNGLLISLALWAALFAIGYKVLT